MVREIELHRFHFFSTSQRHSDHKDGKRRMRERNPQQWLRTCKEAFLGQRRRIMVCDGALQYLPAHIAPSLIFSASFANAAITTFFAMPQRVSGAWSPSRTYIRESCLTMARYASLKAD